MRAAAGDTVQKGASDVDHVYLSKQRDLGEATTVIGRAGTGEYRLVREETQNLGGFARKPTPRPIPDELSTTEPVALDDADPPIYLETVAALRRAAEAEAARDKSGDVIPLPPIPQPAKEGNQS
jgi:hypothetical protein